MNEEQYADVKAKIASNETEHASFRRRLDEHDSTLKQVSNMQVLLERLTNSISNLTSGIGEVKTTMQSVDARVAALEKEPADKWKKITWEVIKAVILAAVGAVITLVIKG